MAAPCVECGDTVESVSVNGECSECFCSPQCHDHYREWELRLEHCFWCENPSCDGECGKG